MENQDVKKGTLRRNFLPYAVIGFLVLGLLGVIFSIVEYRALENNFDRSEEFSDSENYAEASRSLERAEDSWLANLMDIRKSSIENLSEDIKFRIEDQKSYQAGVEIGNSGDWEGGATLLSEIPSNSFYYQRAQTSIEQFKGNVLALELETEQENRRTAEDEVESQILVLNLVQEALDSEIAERLSAESATQAALETVEKERLAKEEIQRDATLQAERADLEREAKFLAQIEAISQSQRADLEEAAKDQAEANALTQTERADSEEAAKIQAQIDAQAQQRRANLEEMARIQQLAVTNPMIQAIVAGELKFYFEPLPAFAGIGVFNAIEEISSRFSSWVPYGATIRRVFNANDADLTVSWLKNFGIQTIGESILKAHIKVGIGKDNCHGDWQAFDANTVKKVLWHEIGHSMGYGHSSNSINVMYWQTETRFDVEQEISDIVSPGWYFTYPLCNRGNYSYSFYSDDSNKRFDLYVLPPGTDASQISIGEGLVYTECGNANTGNYSDTCNVPAGAVIYIENGSFLDAVRLNGEIVLLDEPSWPDMVWDQAVFQYDDAQLNGYWNLFH